MSFLKTYQESILPKVQKELGLKNIMAAPRLVKVVVNVGVKEAMTDKKVLDAVTEQLGAITGQRPVVRKAKKSIAAFKLREGQPVGVCVTLRGKKMMDFLEKLFKITLSRVRDFRGVPKSGFDGHGNYTLGFKEQIVFPEIDYSKIDKIRGLEVTIVTTAYDDQKGEALLKELGMPFEKS